MGTEGTAPRCDGVFRQADREVRTTPVTSGGTAPGPTTRLQFVGLPQYDPCKFTIEGRPMGPGTPPIHRYTCEFCGRQGVEARACTAELAHSFGVLPKRERTTPSLSL